MRRTGPSQVIVGLALVVLLATAGLLAWQRGRSTSTAAERARTATPNRREERPAAAPTTTPAPTQSAAAVPEATPVPSPTPAQSSYRRFPRPTGERTEVEIVDEYAPEPTPEPTATPEVVAQEPVYTQVSGQAVDPDRRGLPGVKVLVQTIALVPKPGERFSASHELETDREGRYAVNVADARAVSIVATPPENLSQYAPVAASREVEGMPEVTIDLIFGRE